MSDPHDQEDFRFEWHGNTLVITPARQCGTNALGLDRASCQPS